MAIGLGAPANNLEPLRESGGREHEGKVVRDVGSGTGLDAITAQPARICASDASRCAIPCPPLPPLHADAQRCMEDLSHSAACQACALSAAFQQDNLSRFIPLITLPTAAPVMAAADATTSMITSQA